MKDKAQDNGFTLVEVLVVLVIIAMVAGLSLPMLDGSSPTRNLAVETRHVAALLATARADALRTGRNSAAIIDLKVRQISLEQGAAVVPIPKGISISINAAAREIEGKTARVRFFADGGSTGGRIVLTSGGMSREIAVNWLTGAIVVQEPTP